jgi:Mg/Co/Ni transporter MgtE
LRIRRYSPRTDVVGGETPRHTLVETLVHKGNLGRLAQIVNGLDAVEAARILEALPDEDRQLAWEQVRRDRLDSILLLVSDEPRGTTRELDEKSHNR